MALAWLCPHTKKTPTVRVRDLNAMTDGDCAALLLNVVERWPAAAEAICSGRPYQTADHVTAAAGDYLDCLAPADKEEVLCSHPDLGSKEQLTEESNREQHMAGLQTNSKATVSGIHELSLSYKSKFGFPFVICARENKPDTILEGLRRRLQNSKEDELETGISEVKKICNLRIKDLVED
ncbi:2-oxo-4-hydroxy-4-carboxy-5-ureidoimidazoline decarboxylase-like isoform X2 [Schistocerca nitens]|nr:2-oxo-4-hydroxy-4-carboxy-5-ureidoimidazoline decarboxylase-like isoform X2 [Schistocerca nitens]